MTQAAVESLAITNFIQEFSSAILSSLVSIVIQTASCREINGFKIGQLTPFKAHRAQVSLDSGRSQRGQVGAQEGRNSLQSVRCSHKICSSVSSRPTSCSFEYLQGQFQKISSKTSLLFTPPSATLHIITNAGDIVSLHVLLRQLWCSRRTSTHVQTSFKKHQKNSHAFSSRERGSGRFKRSSSSSCYSIWFRSSRESESGSRTNVNQLRWNQSQLLIRWCQLHGEEGRSWEESNQRLSHHCLQASRVMSFALFYPFFCGFVVFLLNSLHPSHQSSVQKSNAQPFVTEAVFDSTSESEQSASLASLASLKQITSTINGVSIQCRSRCISGVSRSSSSSRWCDHAVSGSYLDRQQSRSRSIGFSSPQDRGGNVKPHGQRSVSRGFGGQVCDHGLIAEFKDGHVSSVRGRQALCVKLQEFKCFIWLRGVHGNITSGLLGHPQRCRVQALSAASCASGSSCQGVKSPTQLETPSEVGRLHLSRDLPHCGSLHSSWITSISTNL